MPFSTIRSDEKALIHSGVCTSQNETIPDQGWVPQNKKKAINICNIAIIFTLNPAGSPCSDVPGPAGLPIGINLLENSEFMPDLSLSIERCSLCISLRSAAPCRLLRLDEDRFLSAVLHYTNSSTVHFKLSPAYVLYATGRSALRTHAAAARIINKSVAMTESVIQVSPSTKMNAFLPPRPPPPTNSEMCCSSCTEAEEHRRGTGLLDGKLI